MTRPSRALWLMLIVGGLSAALGTDRSFAAAPASDNVWSKYIVRSPSSGKIERFWVGHPKRLKSDGKYPVIYFLPGLLDHDDTWKKALDPHLASYELIAVCPAVGGATWHMDSPAQPWMKWGTYLLGDLRTFVETRYPASNQKGQRGIAGISVGGHGAFYHAIRHADYFGSVSVLSGSVELRGYAGRFGLDYWIGPPTGPAKQAYADRSCVVLAARHSGPLPFALFLDAGDKDGALAMMQPFHNLLSSRGAKHRWYVGAGGHDWTYWKSRANDHLAFHAEQFDRNRRESRYEETPKPLGGELEILKTYPPAALSPPALATLKAPWNPRAEAKPLRVNGLPPEGAPLSKTNTKYKEAKFPSTLTASGHKPARFAYALTLVVSTPLPRAGNLTLSGILRNGRGAYLLTVPKTALPVPAGEADRKVTLRARLVVELLDPDPIRGGVAIGIQPFDAAGKPLGKPATNALRPGTFGCEQWPIDPRARVDWLVSLAGDDDLPMAAVHEIGLADEHEAVAAEVPQAQAPE